MPDFNVRSDSVNVEQIMEQIRARIREKRGIDYTEQQLRELAAVKLEKFLDPRGVRSDLLEQFKRRQPTYEPPVLPSFAFEGTTIYETHRGVLRFIRRLLNPILKLFFNPNTISHALHVQADLNKVNAEREAVREKQRLEVDALYYEVIHNLVFEMTRLGIETKNVKMRAESLASRLEFNERRARALESAVVYKPATEEPVPAAAPPPRAQPSSAPQRQAPSPAAAQPPSITAPAQVSSTGSGQAASTGSGPSAGSGQGGTAGSGPAAGTPEGPGQRSRRRRRRRGRRGGPSAVATMGAGQPSTSNAEPARPEHTVSDGEPARREQMTAETPPLSLEQAFATDVQPSERRQELPETTPAPAAPAPESAGRGPDTAGDDGDTGDDDPQ